MRSAHGREYVGFARWNIEEAGLVSSFHVQAAGTFKLTDAFPVDGVGDIKPDFLPNGLIVTADEAGPGIGVSPGNPALTVGAPATVATINTIGDQDWFAVTLEAGKVYEIGQYSLAGGPNGVALADPYIELYDSAGNLIVTADGGADTPYNAINSGFDVLLTYEAEVGGTYYVNARAFDNVPEDGPGGDSVGDYSLFVREAIDTYRPFYDVDSPLYALDWGSQVNKIHESARNPDGDEGPRPTGNDPGTPGSNTFGIEGKNVITYYFAKAGEIYLDDDPTTVGTTETMVAKGFADWEKAAYEAIFAEYEKVADIVYVEVDNVYDLAGQDAAADFVLITYLGTPGPGVSLLGRMSPPDEENEGHTEFNAADERWTEEGLAQGGFSFVTLAHELGHGHGIAHPHDNGGRSGVMHGVEPNGPLFDYTLGDFNLNQGVFTMMSYQDGWVTSPYGQAETNAGYGWLGGPMAFDIAVLQDKYGVNEESATGDDSYVMKDVNAPGTFYYAIWDAGGVDEIVYDGARDANVDLRAASLLYEEGGGGWVSYAFGIHGGFTIANGVTIENARTGAGHDRLTGNAAANILDGGAGNDLLFLQTGGDDMAIGGNGADGFYFGAAYTSADGVDGGLDPDTVALQGNYAGLVLGAMEGVEVLLLASGTDAQFGDTSGAAYSYGLASIDSNVAAGAILTVQATGLKAGESVSFNGSAESDGHFRIYTGLGDDDLTGGAGDDGFLFGAEGNFTGADRVNGGAGIDSIALRGNYVGAGKAVFDPASLTDVETLVLLSGHTDEFGGLIVPDGFDYDVTMADGNVAAGARMEVAAGTLGADESVVFDGRAESDGSFRIISGAGDDSLFGGANADTLYGGNGADSLDGSGGADLYVYRFAGESTAAATDAIVFGAGDRIDLSLVDANEAAEGNQAFAFIGSAAFTQTAGELRAVQGPNGWTVEGDVDGDGTADLVLALTTPAPLTATDFIL